MSGVHHLNPIKMSKAAHKICKKMTKISAKKQNSTDLWSSGAVINTMSFIYEAYH